MRQTPMIAALLLVPCIAHAASLTLVRADASESSVRGDGAVAFIARVDGRPVLAWMPAAGGPAHRLEMSGLPDTPAWSPDGTRIALSVERDGDADIVVVDALTGAVQAHVRSPDPDLHPAWTADGQRLVYTRFVRDADGTQTLRLFERDLRPGGSDVPLLRGAQASYGAWSPAGDWLVFWQFAPGDNAEIVVARGDGSVQRRLTDTPAFDAWPAWSPDGRNIAFARERGELADIHVVALDGSRECVVAAGAGRKTSPKWTRDGRTLLFDRRHDGHTDVWRVEVPAACFEPVTVAPGGAPTKGPESVVSGLKIEQEQRRRTWPRSGCGWSS